MTQSNVLFAVIVGAHFNPPAKGLLQALPQSSPLILRPDPGNPYDEHCIDVLVEPQAFPPEADALLEGLLPGMGHDWSELRDNGEPLMLGYIPRRGGKPLIDAAARGEALADNETIAERGVGTCKATFVVTGDGAPGVRLEWPSQEETAE